MIKGHFIIFQTTNNAIIIRPKASSHVRSSGIKIAKNITKRTDQKTDQKTATQIRSSFFRSVVIAFIPFPLSLVYS